MSEYIEREFALNVLCRENCGHDYEANKCNNCYTSNFINYLPTADVAEVKHGKWIQEQIKIENMSIVRYRNTCSECGGKADFLLRELHYSYCPHCGAKMDLED